ncbi:MAG: type I 3-dehydroquinate dehydratase [Leptospirales bacterium]|nr:type I 3-dehydroquinate dehydratase [Leptospirales bacterium]
MPRLGSIEVTAPEIIGVVDSVIAQADLDRLSARGLRVLEFRFDSFKEPIAAAVELARANRPKFAILGTMRETETNSKSLESAHAQFIEVVDAVDIEIATKEPLCSSLVSIVRNAGKQLMISHHNFSNVPATGDLNSIYEQARRMSPDFIKFAIAARSRAEVESLMRFLVAHTGEGVPLSVFAMGKPGLISRVAAGMLGSLFTYGYLTEPNAPGQLSAVELLDLKDRLYPEI